MDRFSSKVAEHLDRVDSESLKRQYRHLAGEVGFFETVFDAIAEGVIVAGADGLVLYANNAALSFFGLTFERIHGESLGKIFGDLDWKQFIALPDEGGWSRVATRELEITYPERRILELKARPSKRGTVILVRDVTLERARNEAEIENEKTAAIKELAAGVAHEIGNPLNALSINLQLMEREFKGADSDSELQHLHDVQSMRSEVKRIADINRLFLTAMRPSRIQPVPGSISDPLTDTLTALRQQLEDRRIKVLIDLPPALPLVMIDRAQMEQVFFNIVKNAMEAIKDGGTLSFVISSDDREVWVSIRDSGVGMTDAALANLFKPYATTKARGTGLGLMLSRRIVREHGGEIDVESKAGEGTKFTVRLPRVSKRVRELCQG